MATTTHRISTASTLNTTSYASGSFTPAAGELLVAFVTASDTIDPGALTDSQGLNFQLITSVVKRTSLDTLYCFVATRLAANSAMTVTFGCPGDAATGCVIQVAGVSGMTRVGIGAIRYASGTAQITVLANQTAATTPAPAFPASCLTGNPTLGLVGNGTNVAAMSPPASWTEQNDTGYATPTTGAEYVSRDSGFTGTTVTWGNVSASAYGAIIIELDTTTPALMETLVDTYSGAAVDPALWTVNTGAGTVVEGSGVLTFTPASNTAGDGQSTPSLISYNLTGSYAVVKVSSVLTGDEFTSLLCEIGGDGKYRLNLAQYNGNLEARDVIAGTETVRATATYNGTTMLWWRIREASGTVFWDYSADGISWTNLFSETNPFAVLSMQARLETYENTAVVSPGTAVYDNFNNGPKGLPPGNRIFFRQAVARAGFY